MGRKTGVLACHGKLMRCPARALAQKMMRASPGMNFVRGLWHPPACVQWATWGRSALPSMLIRLRGEMVGVGKKPRLHGWAGALRALCALWKRASSRWSKRLPLSKRPFTAALSRHPRSSHSSCPACHGGEESPIHVATERRNRRLQGSICPPVATSFFSVTWNGRLCPSRLLQNLHGHRRAASSLRGVKASRPLTAEVLQEPPSYAQIMAATMPRSVRTSLFW